MRNKSILLKSIICGSVCLIFLFILIFVVYILDFFAGAYIVGLLCGVIMAFVTYCDTLKRTVIAGFMGMLSAVVLQFIFEMSGAAYAILMYIFRNDTFVREAGYLTVNETIGYGWGRMLFWIAFIISFLVSIISIHNFNKIKNRKN